MIRSAHRSIILTSWNSTETSTCVLSECLREDASGFPQNSFLPNSQQDQKVQPVQRLWKSLHELLKTAPLNILLLECYVAQGSQPAWSASRKTAF
jgi:hypothetical protein